MLALQGLDEEKNKGPGKKYRIPAFLPGPNTPKSPANTSGLLLCPGGPGPPSPSAL